MLQRALLLIIVVALCAFALQSFSSWYFSMQLAEAGGQRYLVLEHRASSPDGGEIAFSIYRAKGNDCAEWEPVVSSRLGRAYGVFTSRPHAALPLPAPAREGGEGAPPTPAKGVGEEKKESAVEQLGILHRGRVTFYDVSEKTATPTFELLPFPWIAETVVPYKGALLAFGVDLPPYEGKPRYGPLKVARYDGQKWDELHILGPRVHEGKSGFSLQALEMPDGIRVFWREGEFDQALSEDIEGPRATTDGPLTMALFKDGAFQGDPVSIANLPRGNTDVWAEGGQLKVLLQRRDKREGPFTSNGPLEIWDIEPDGNAKLGEAISDSRARNGLVAFIAAKHFTWRGQEFILRSNWQTFEVWRKTPETGWVRSSTAPKGLPQYDLGGLMLAALGVALALIVFGAGLAYHRRRQVWTILHKVQASEIYASLGLRMGAFAVDLTLIMFAALYLDRVLGRSYISPVELLRPDFTRLPPWPFFGIYLGYLATAECLLGTTLGKGLMGLSVVSDTGLRPSFWAALVRNLVGFYERLPYTFIIAMPMIIFGPRRQRLGDLLAHTFVVQKRALEIFKAQRAAGLEGEEGGQGKRRSSGLLPPVEMKFWSVGGRKRKKDDE